MSSGGSMGSWQMGGGSSTTGINQQGQKQGMFGMAQQLLGQGTGNPFSQGYQPPQQQPMPAQMPNYGQWYVPNFSGIPGNDALRNFQQQQYDQARLQQAAMQQQPVSIPTASVPTPDQRMWAGGSPNGFAIENPGTPPMQQGLGSFMRGPGMSRGRWQSQ